MAQVGPQQAPQLHDYEPGISDNGVFWTVPVSPRSLGADLRTGNAFFRLKDYAIPDWYNFPNSLAQGPHEPAHVSFNLEFFGPGKPFVIDKPDQQFKGRFLANKCRISWSSRNEGFSFVSAPAKSSTSVYAAVGRERNGVFYRR